MGCSMILCSIIESSMNKVSMMAKLEISNKTAEQLTELSRRAQKSVDELLAWLLNNYGHTLMDIPDSETWTDEELEALLKPKPPLTGKQIVEKHLASGVIGSWSDEGITDSLEWLEQQRAKRRNKYQW